MYYVKKKKIKVTPQLLELAKECGRVYSKTVSTFWKLNKKKGSWLSKNSMQKLIKREALYSQTVQACIDSFYNNLKAWRNLKKNGNSTARPPKRGRKTFLIQYKGQCLRLKNGILFLPNGKKNKDIQIPWSYEKPILLTIKVKSDTATLSACYKQSDVKKKEVGRTVALDLGTIHLAASSDGWTVSGRKLRSLKRYQNKVKGTFATLQSKKIKHSNAWKKLQRRKQKTLTKLNNQISDFIHKATTGIVSTLEHSNVKTLVIGDLNGIRDENDKGKVRNQENHQWNYSKITWQLSYKAERKGITVALEKEYYTSSTCPICGEITKTKTRNFRCSKCKFEMHRDLLGANNILKKYLPDENQVVVGCMTHPIGVRLKSNSSVATGFKNIKINIFNSLEVPGI